jgi:hypothetical protein
MTRAKTKTKWATRNQVEAIAKEWTEAVLLCRTLGHSWRQSNAVHVRRLHYWQVSYNCDRGCGCIKYQEWSERGVVYASWMIYPRDNEGRELYLTEGIGRVAGDIKGALRIESVTRTNFTETSGRATDEDEPRSSRTLAAVTGAKRNGGSKA